MIKKWNNKNNRQHESVKEELRIHLNGIFKHADPSKITPKDCSYFLVLKGIDSSLKRDRNSIFDKTFDLK